MVVVFGVDLMDEAGEVFAYVNGEDLLYDVGYTLWNNLQVIFVKVEKHIFEKVDKPRGEVRQSE